MDHILCLHILTPDTFARIIPHMMENDTARLIVDSVLDLATYIEKGDGCCICCGAKVLDAEAVGHLAVCRNSDNTPLLPNGGKALGMIVCQQCATRPTMREEVLEAMRTGVFAKAETFRVVNFHTTAGHA